MNITASCFIGNGMMVKNKFRLFESSASGPDTLLMEAYHHFRMNYPKFYKMDRLSKLGWMASELLLTGSLNINKYKPEEIGVVLANANSSLDTDIKYQHTIKDFPSPSVFVYTLPNIVIGEICIRNNFKGEHAFYIQQKFDAAFMEQQVNYLLTNNILQACICGWVDLLDDDYKAALFLAEKMAYENEPDFCINVMNDIFNNN